VTSALEATGRVRGPLITIRDGIDFDALAKASKGSRDIDLLIVASKARAPTPGSPAAPGELGRKLETRLRRPGRRIHLIESRVPREELLHWLGRSAVTLFLPNRKEGFYLPALEGMALGTIVVCPDCIGNRSFCLPGRNCFRPRYEVGKLVEATEEALANHASLGEMIDEASRTAQEHDLVAERAAFLDVLRQVDAIWERI
jgi:glycosyltransferase involved in cell wall biosynthesis